MYETSPLPRGRCVCVCVCVCVCLRVGLQTYACINVNVYKRMHFHNHTRARSLLTPQTPFSLRTWTPTQRGCSSTSEKSQRTGAQHPNRTRRRRHHLRLRYGPRAQTLAPIRARLLPHSCTATTPAEVQATHRRMCICRPWTQTYAYMYTAVYMYTYVCVSLTQTYAHTYAMRTCIQRRVGFRDVCE